MYILPRSTNVLSFLHNSVIWIWWGSAPPAPNVETPLKVYQCVKIQVVKQFYCNYILDIQLNYIFNKDMHLRLYIEMRLRLR